MSFFRKRDEELNEETPARCDQAARLSGTGVANPLADAPQPPTNPSVYGAALPGRDARHRGFEGCDLALAKGYSCSLLAAFLGDLFERRLSPARVPPNLHSPDAPATSAAAGSTAARRHATTGIASSAPMDCRPEPARPQSYVPKARPPDRTLVAGSHALQESLASRLLGLLLHVGAESCGILVPGDGEHKAKVSRTAGVPVHVFAALPATD